MTADSQRIRAYCFGPYRLCLAERMLERNGRRVPLTPKAIDTLLVFVRNAPFVLTSEALMKEVWPDVTVVASGLTRNICVLRKELNDGMPHIQAIETIPKRGYRFVAEVQPELTEPEALNPQPCHADASKPRFALRAVRTVAAVLGAIWRSRRSSGAHRITDSFGHQRT